MTTIAIAYARTDTRSAELPPAERALLSAAASEKRAREFAAGRRAARAAIGNVSGDGDAIVLRDEAGRPVIARGPRHLHVSISHADGTAVAAAARAQVGVDVITIEDLGAPFVRESFRPGELRAWSDLLDCDERSPLAACAGFAAKEAVLKCLGVGLTVSLRSIALTPRRRPTETTISGLPGAQQFALGGLDAWLARRGPQLVALALDTETGGQP